MHQSLLHHMSEVENISRERLDQSSQPHFGASRHQYLCVLRLMSCCVPSADSREDSSASR